MNAIAKEHRRAIFTVPGDMGRESCWDTEIHQILDGHLSAAMLQGAKQFLRTRALEGDAFVANEGIHVYGPFPSPVMLEAMVSNEVMRVTPTERDQMITERANSTSAFSHYLLNASFLVARKGAPKE